MTGLYDGYTIENSSLIGYTLNPIFDNSMISGSTLKHDWQYFAEYALDTLIVSIYPAWKHGPIFDKSTIINSDLSFPNSKYISKNLIRLPCGPGYTVKEISKMKNVTLTPHSAWLTTQSMEKLLFAGLNLLKKHIEQS